jgi:hypothetical protein
MPSARDKRPSEYGGVPGRIAPLPHELDAAEAARLERAAEPTDGSDDATAALVRERRMEGRA